MGVEIDDLQELLDELRQLTRGPALYGALKRFPNHIERQVADGSGWESNPPDDAMRRLNGFEDRGAHQEP